MSQCYYGHVACVPKGASPEEVKSEEHLQKTLDEHPWVIIDFYANWCGPCMQLMPHLNRLSAQYPWVKVLKVNADDHKYLLQKANVASLPTLVLLGPRKTSNQSRMRDRMMGNNATELKGMFDQATRPDPAGEFLY